MKFIQFENGLVSAIQYLGDVNKYNVCEFVKGNKFQADFNGDTMTVNLEVQEVSIHLAKGDWLIKRDLGGSFESVEDKLFKATFEQHCKCTVSRKKIIKCDDCK